MAASLRTRSRSEEQDKSDKYTEASDAKEEFSSTNETPPLGSRTVNFIPSSSKPYSTPKIKRRDPLSPEDRLDNMMKKHDKVKSDSVINTSGTDSSPAASSRKMRFRSISPEQRVQSLWDQGKEEEEKK